MGKRSLIFNKHRKLVKNLWEDALRDIVKDFSNYLLENPLESGIKAGNFDCRYDMFLYGKDGELYARSPDPLNYFVLVPYQEDNFDMNFYIFSCCIKYPHILNDILSDESRVDIKIVMDSYFGSLDNLIKEGGITKLKHVYPYVSYPVVWNFRDSSIKSISPNSDRIEYIWDPDTEDYINLFGEPLIRRKGYNMVISYFRNKKKFIDSVSLNLNLDGFKNFINQASNGNSD